MRHPHLLCIAIAVIVSLSCSIGGCSAGRYNVEFHLQPNGSASVRVFGENPTFELSNDGPGELQLKAESNISGLIDDRTIGIYSTGRTLRGGGTLMLRTGEVGANVRFEARDASGFELIQQPSQ